MRWHQVLKTSYFRLFSLPLSPSSNQVMQIPPARPISYLSKAKSNHSTISLNGMLRNGVISGSIIEQIRHLLVVAQVLNKHLVVCVEVLTIWIGYECWLRTSVHTLITPEHRQCISTSRRSTVGECGTMWYDVCSSVNPYMYWTFRPPRSCGLC